MTVTGGVSGATPCALDWAGAGALAAGGRAAGASLAAGALARHALTKTPLTLDHDILLTQLQDVQIGSIPDGTAIGNAIANALGGIRIRDLPVKPDKIVALLHAAAKERS